MPTPIIKAFGILKKSSAIINVNFGLNPKIGNVLITQQMPLCKHPKKSSKASSTPNFHWLFGRQGQAHSQT